MYGSVVVRHLLAIGSGTDPSCRIMYGSFVRKHGWIYNNARIACAEAACLVFSKPRLTLTLQPQELALVGKAQIGAVGAL